MTKFAPGTRCEVRSNYVGIETPFGNINIADVVSCTFNTETNRFSMTWKVEPGRGNGVIDSEDTVEGDTLEEVFLRYVARRLMKG